MKKQTQIQTQQMFTNSEVKAYTHAFILPIVIFIAMLFIQREYALIGAIGMWSISTLVYSGIAMFGKDTETARLFFKISFGVIFSIFFVLVFNILLASVA
ncbi:hypothetical protein SAMN06313486_10153 [Epsilonproteobacteria bacterium SCGC AD-308-P11]|jgi:hypothetical protein|nr:hypothetical protein SAMN06313486_10153 [Epsilonproteobacteria bacterium SCGC AD-308-P11]